MKYSRHGAGGGISNEEDWDYLDKKSISEGGSGAITNEELWPTELI